MLITSSQNAKLKNLRALYKDKKLRAEQGVYIAEGVNLVKSTPNDVKIEQLFIKENKYDCLCKFEKQFGIEANIVKDELFDSVSDTVTPSGIIAVIQRPQNKAVAGEIVLLLDGISDAGNMGTIIRSAAARGIGTVISVDGTEMYSPKAVRASMGGIFSVNCIETDEKSALDMLACCGYEIVALDMGGDSINNYTRSGKIALTVGSEAHGLSSSIKERAKQIVAVPMTKNVESLNAAISISIAMFIIN